MARRGTSYGVWHLQQGSDGDYYLYGSVADVIALLVKHVPSERVDYSGSLSGAKSAAETLVSVKGSGRIVSASEELAARGGLPYEPDPDAKAPELFMGFSYLGRGPKPGQN